MKKHQKKSKRIRVIALITALILAMSAGSVFALPTRDTVNQPSSKTKDHYAFYGIDVSTWQGESIDWNRVKKAGADFVFIRAGATKQDSFSLIEDDTYAANMREAAAAGVSRGIYWYSQATTVDEAKAEAKKAVEMAKGTDPELPIVMDMEFSNGRLDSAYAGWVAEGGSAYAKKMLTDMAEAFLGYVEDHGYTGGLYVSLSLAENTAGVDTSKLTSDGYELWIAQYNENNTSSDDYTYWQYSSVDSIDGIYNHRIDSNYMYVPMKTEKAGHSKVQAQIKYSEVKYNGSPAEPEVTVTDGVKKLHNYEDYTVMYVKNAARGTGYAVIRGKGHYKGYVEAVKFKIGGKNVRTTESSDEPTNVVTTVEDGNTLVKFTAAKSDANDYRIAYRDSDNDEWKYVNTGGRTSYTLEGTPSEIKVSSVRGDKVLATKTPNNAKKTDIIDDVVKSDTTVSGTETAVSNNVRLIDKEVSHDVRLDSSASE